MPRSKRKQRSNDSKAHSSSRRVRARRGGARKEEEEESKGSTGGATEPLRIHFVRHGFVHNPKRVYYGRLPRFRLAPRGEKEAQQAGKYIMTEAIPDLFNLRGIFVSPRLRARQTAAAIAKAHAGVTGLSVPLKPTVTPRLNEILTPGDGLTAKHLDKVGWHTLYVLSKEENEKGPRAPGGVFYEEFPDVVARVRGAIEWARRTYASGHVVFVSHGDCLLSARMIAHNLPATLKARNDNRPKLYLPTASVLTLVVDTDGSISEDLIWSPPRTTAATTLTD